MEKDKIESEMHKSLTRLFGIYKNESKNGKFYLFSENDILEEKYDLQGRKTASSCAEGLHQLGKSIYLVLTGKSEEKDRSLKIDGYPEVKVPFWPTLQLLLSAKEDLTVEEVEEKIKQTEVERKKNEEALERKEAVASETENEPQEIQPQEIEKETVDTETVAAPKSGGLGISLRNTVAVVAAIAVAVMIVGPEIVLKAYLAIGALLVLGLILSKDIQDSMKDESFAGFIALVLTALFWGLFFVVKSGENNDNSSITSE